MIRELLQAQQDSLRSLQNDARLRALKLTRTRLQRVQATLGAMEPGSWGWASQAAVAQQLRAAMTQLARGQVDLLAEGLATTARVSARDAAVYLTALDKHFSGITQPLRFDTVGWVANNAEQISKVRLREFTKSFQRYGASTVLQIEDEIASTLLVGAPWHEARERVMQITKHVVGDRMWMVDRILRTETSAAYNGTQLAAIIEEDTPEDPMMKRLSATFDSRTGRDSVMLHGQIRRAREPFFDPFYGKSYQAPPNRPNDREVVVPWRARYGDAFASDEDPSDEDDGGDMVIDADEYEQATAHASGPGAPLPKWGKPSGKSMGPAEIRAAIVHSELKDLHRQIRAWQSQAAASSAVPGSTVVQQIEQAVARAKALANELDEIEVIQAKFQAVKAQWLAKKAAIEAEQKAAKAAAHKALMTEQQLAKQAKLEMLAKQKMEQAELAKQLAAEAKQKAVMLQQGKLSIAELEAMELKQKVEAAKALAPYRLNPVMAADGLPIEGNLAIAQAEAKAAKKTAKALGELQPGDIVMTKQGTPLQLEGFPVDGKVLVRTPAGKLVDVPVSGIATDAKGLVRVIKEPPVDSKILQWKDPAQAAAQAAKAAEVKAAKAAAKAAAKEAAATQAALEADVATLAPGDSVFTLDGGELIVQGKPYAMPGGWKVPTDKGDVGLAKLEKSSTGKGVLKETKVDKDQLAKYEAEKAAKEAAEKAAADALWAEQQAAQAAEVAAKQAALEAQLAKEAAELQAAELAALDTAPASTQVTLSDAGLIPGKAAKAEVAGSTKIPVTYGDLQVGDVVVSKTGTPLKIVGKADGKFEVYYPTTGKTVKYTPEKLWAQCDVPDGKIQKIVKAPDDAVYLKTKKVEAPAPVTAPAAAKVPELQNIEDIPDAQLMPMQIDDAVSDAEALAEVAQAKKALLNATDLKAGDVYVDPDLGTPVQVLHELEDGTISVQGVGWDGYLDKNLLADNAGLDGKIVIIVEPAPGSTIITLDPAAKKLLKPKAAKLTQEQLDDLSKPIEFDTGDMNFGEVKAALQADLAEAKLVPIEWDQLEVGDVVVTPQGGVLQVAAKADGKISIVTPTNSDPYELDLDDAHPLKKDLKLVTAPPPGAKVLKPKKFPSGKVEAPSTPETPAVVPSGKQGHYIDIKAIKDNPGGGGFHALQAEVKAAKKQLMLTDELTPGDVVVLSDEGASAQVLSIDASGKVHMQWPNGNKGTLESYHLTDGKIPVITSAPEGVYLKHGTPQIVRPKKSLFDEPVGTDDSPVFKMPEKIGDVEVPTEVVASDLNVGDVVQKIGGTKKYKVTAIDDDGIHFESEDGYVDLADPYSLQGFAPGGKVTKLPKAIAPAGVEISAAELEVGDTFETYTGLKYKVHSKGADGKLIVEVLHNGKKIAASPGYFENTHGKVTKLAKVRNKPDLMAAWDEVQEEQGSLFGWDPSVHVSALAEDLKAAHFVEKALDDLVPGDVFMSPDGQIPYKLVSHDGGSFTLWTPITNAEMTVSADTMVGVVGMNPKVLASLPKNPKHLKVVGKKGVKPKPVVEAPPPPPAPEAPHVAPAAAPKVVDVDKPNWQQVGQQKGSNPGGLYRDKETGEQFYVKTPKTEDIARNEALAAQLYRLAGVEAPEYHLAVRNGTASIASRIIEGLENGAHALKAGTVEGVGEGFVADAWLANWDVVGLSHDNLLVKGGKAFRIDTGGALRYRAQGGKKPFGDEVLELDTLRDASTNPQAAGVFKHVTDDQIRAGIDRITAISDDAIEALVEHMGPKDVAERKALAATLKARREHLRKLRGTKYADPTPEPLADMPAGPYVAPAPVQQGTPGWNIAVRKSEDHVRNEALASELYQAAGIDVADARLVEGAEVSVAERVLEGATSATATAQGVKEGFVVDAWLANWTAANYMQQVGGKAVRRTMKGALRYRGGGELKGAAFGDDVPELDLFRNASKNPQAAALYAEVTAEDIVAGIDRVASLSDDKIMAIVQAQGPRDLAERTKMAQTLIARRNHLKAQRHVWVARIEAEKAAKIAKLAKEAAERAAALAAEKAAKEAAEKALGQVKERLDQYFPNRDRYMDGVVVPKLAERFANEARLVARMTPEQRDRYNTAVAREESAREGATLRGVRPTGPVQNLAEDKAAAMRAAKKWGEDLTPAERGAISAWSGSGYGSMRSADSGLAFAENIDNAEDLIRARERVAHIRTAFAKAPRTEGTFLRGMRLDKPEAQLLYEQVTSVGAELTLPDMASWSYDPQIARNFSGYGSRSVVLRVREGRHGILIEPISQYKTECEVMVDKGLRYRVVGVTEEAGGRKIVDLEIVGGEEDLPGGAPVPFKKPRKPRAKKPKP